MRIEQIRRIINDVEEQFGKDANIPFVLITILDIKKANKGFEPLDDNEIEEVLQSIEASMEMNLEDEIENAINAKLDER